MSGDDGRRPPPRGSQAGHSRTGPLTEMQRKALAMRLDGATWVAAARATGIPEGTLKRLNESKRGQEYTSKLQAERDEEDRAALRASRRGLTRSLPKAIATLNRIMDDADAPHHAKVAASRTILEHGLPAQVEVGGIPGGEPVRIERGVADLSDAELVEMQRRLRGEA